MAHARGADFMFCDLCGTMMFLYSKEHVECPSCKFKKSAKDLSEREISYQVSSEDMRRDLGISHFEGKMEVKDMEVILWTRIDFQLAFILDLLMRAKRPFFIALIAHIRLLRTDSPDVEASKTDLHRAQAMYVVVSTTRALLEASLVLLIPWTLDLELPISLKNVLDERVVNKEEAHQFSWLRIPAGFKAL
ncbi:hypothetical protein SADUNF_Sadunf13G0012500 [Salix dunnii]|uniref:Uncharacterized protein n=1 Tax=Salix dunnii TaxID=1413687 RepID=A0A835JK67_9ROSI|nr:hypothetical protein SADUNF_Sadunf13G0012500 [Salix dunnii]